MKDLLHFLFSTVALVGLASCANLRELDRERLNHRSMDLGAYEAKRNSAPLSQLSGIGAGGAAAGCSVCAH